MAFWGVVVKPGKPVFYSGTKAKRKLRITKATLGIGSSTKKSFTQCKVLGTETGFLLCALLPNIIETCPLNFVFGETDRIMFSVVGPPSATVYLTGYHFFDNQILDQYTNSIAEPLGIDMEYNGDETEGCNRDSSGASDIAASSRRGKKKSENKNRKYEQLKKKNQSNDEDGYMLSIWKDIEED